MAPNTSSFLSRFSKTGGNNPSGAEDPNGRHSRMASASSAFGYTTTPPSSPPSINVGNGNGAVSGNGLKAAKPMPKLVLTTDSYESDSIHAPGSSRPSPKSILNEDKDPATLSPEEVRSSEEEQMRRVNPIPGPIEMNIHAPSPQDVTTPRPPKGKASASSLKDLTTPQQPTFEPNRSRANTTNQLLVPGAGMSDEGNISDTASIISVGGTKKKKRLFRRGSNASFRSSKPDPSKGALGAALAASAMSLAQTTGNVVPQQSSVSPQQLRKDTAKVTAAAPSFAQRLRRGSGASTSGSDIGDEGSGSEGRLSLGDDIISPQITGFAVASNKRNAEFHELFPDVPEDDYLIEDYGCALQKEILHQGRLYISENHMCFHANIFGWVTNFIVPFTSVQAIEKKMTAYVIPNAVLVSTPEQRYFFASFISRDTTFDVLSNIWRLARPSIDDADRVTFSDGGSVLASETGPSPRSMSLDLKGTNSLTGAGEKMKKGSASAPGPAIANHRATICECSKKKQHYPETVMDTVLPGTPEKIYNLMFASGFVKDFMAQDQKLLSIQISDWQPASAGSQLLQRHMSYIKPLNAPVGPKSTKCELSEQTVHVDFDDWVSTVTTTRTPDVPSGGSFACKTRTCITWAGGMSTKVVVTTTVEWSGWSVLKGIIQSSAIDGQRQYHGDLERAMRKYIASNPSEFGVFAEASLPAAAGPLSPQDVQTPSAEKTLTEMMSNDRRGVAERRSLQWALDTFTGAMKLTTQSFTGLLEILSDYWDGDDGDGKPTGGWTGRIWWIAVLVLVGMNVWTWTSLNQSRSREAHNARRTALHRVPTPEVVASKPLEPPVDYHTVATEAVRVFWEAVVEKQTVGWKTELEGQIAGLRDTVARLEAKLEERSSRRRFRPLRDFDDLD